MLIITELPTKAFNFFETSVVSIYPVFLFIPFYDNIYIYILNHEIQVNRLHQGHETRYSISPYLLHMFSWIGDKFETDSSRQRDNYFRKWNLRRQMYRILISGSSEIIKLKLNMYDSYDIYVTYVCMIFGH